jgi:hypothetical protein
MTTIDDVLRNGAVRSLFQPIVELDTGRVVAYEALARGPQGPLERPDHLFAAARAAGRLTELDAACRSAALTGALAAGLVTPLTLFVNVEPEVLDRTPMEELLANRAGRPGRAASGPGDHGARAGHPAGRAAAHRRAGPRSAGAWRWTTSAPRRCRWPSCRCCARTW